MLHGSTPEVGSEQLGKTLIRLDERAGGAGVSEPSDSGSLDSCALLEALGDCGRVNRAGGPHRGNEIDGDFECVPHLESRFGSLHEVTIGQINPMPWSTSALGRSFEDRVFT